MAAGQLGAPLAGAFLVLVAWVALTGAFHLDSAGRMVSADGYPILDDQNQPITLPKAGVEARVRFLREQLLSAE